MDCDEVRKRKEYAERKVKERHAALRKEAEERRKQAVEHRERVQSVLKREQVLLQKRMQQLNEDEERKKVTLAKQHEATSRIAAVTKSPKSFAFGSSTPRTLAYLDNLPKSEQLYDKKLRPLDDSSQVSSETSTNAATTTKMNKIMTTPQRPPPAAHRLPPTKTSMTSSMYVTSSAPPSRHAKMIGESSVTTTTTSKRLSHGSSMMTQSVYTPTSRPKTTTRSSIGVKSNRGTTPASGTPQSLASTPVPTNNRRSLGTRKPPMPLKSTVRKPDVKKQVTTSAGVPVVVEKKSATELTSFDVFENQHATIETVERQTTKGITEEIPVLAVVAENEGASNHAHKVESIVRIEEAIERMEENLEASSLPDAQNSASTHSQSKFYQSDDCAVENINGVLTEIGDDEVSSEVNQVFHEDTSFAMQKDTPYIEVVIADSNEQKREKNEVESKSENEKSTVQISEENILNEETSESNSKSSTITCLADEVKNIGVDFNESHKLSSKAEVVELNYPLPDEPSHEVPKPAINAANDLVDVFGNDFINENRPQRIVEFDEDTDSGKASPTLSETSSTIDEVTPRSVITDANIVAPRVLPIVRSAEDMAKKEKEAREAEERKNRLAAILAKSRGMASLMTNALPATSADTKDSTFSPVTSPPTSPSPLPVEQPTSSSNVSSEETAEKAANDPGRANDVLARVAAMTNSSTLQKILQRKQGSNPSLQTSESTGGEIY